MVVFYQLDVSNESRINRVYRKQLMQQFTRLDVLVNNAAILYDTWQQHAINADLEVVNQAIITNLFGSWRLSQVFVPIMKRNKYGRIVNVSSGAEALCITWVVVVAVVVVEHHQPIVSLKQLLMHLLGF